MLEYEQALLRLLENPSSPRLGLERAEHLLQLLGRPQDTFRSIHIAGTNGKGSTAAFCEAQLRYAHIKTGLFTSPHLLRATERVRIDGAEIGRAEFCAQEDKVARAAASMEEPPTFFERMMAIAFLCFRDHQVELAVVEVGLGGRLDSTNILQPVASGVARIALDHQTFLGDTLAEIAKEKAGILKKGVPAFSVPQTDGVKETLRDAAVQAKTSLEFVGSVDRDLPLLGAHQKSNAALAFALVGAIGVQPNRAADSLVFWPGRFERIGDFLLDGAHNPDAAAALVELGVQLGEVPDNLVLGCTRGHDFRNFLRIISGLNPKRIFVSQSSAPRSMKAAELAQMAGNVGVHVDPISVMEIPNLAKSGNTWVTGSLYLVGEVRGLLLQEDRDPVLPDF